MLKLGSLKSDQNLIREVGDLLWKDVVKTEKCWFWCGKLYPNGYGQFVYKRERRVVMVVEAHRLAYLLQHNADPGELLVCHTCDNKRCVRGDHFFLGTHLDNMRDHSQKYQARKAAQ